MPDVWEEAILKDFDRRAAAGEPAGNLEKGERVLVDGKPVYRYMKALPTIELCLQCHGDRDRLSPLVQTTLQRLYPNDRAMGYQTGEVRGAMTLSKAL